MCVDVFKPSHSEMKLFLKHELNWIALYSVQHRCAQLCNTGWFPIKMPYKGLLPTALRCYGNSGLTFCYGSETSMAQMTSKESKLKEIVLFKSHTMIMFFC